VRNSKVGDSMVRGISGGEMRRLSVAQELLCDPKVLFLDECTSGLDTMSAYRMIKLLKRVALQRSTAVVCSIHQPSSQIFFAFDRLLLLTKNSESIGELAFFGPVDALAPYVDKLGYPCPTNINIADHACMCAVLCVCVCVCVILWSVLT
jgi:ATP-binding cassette, subfamily G (WHITE), member 2